MPRGNPDRLEWVRASKWLAYPIDGKETLARGDYEVAHGGYDAAFAAARKSAYRQAYRTAYRKATRSCSKKKWRKTPVASTAFPTW